LEESDINRKNCERGRGKKGDRERKGTENGVAERGRNKWNKCLC